MRLSKLSISNFRSIKQLEIELPQMCALVGPNNAGKSNLLEAIRRVLLPDWGPQTRDFSEDDVFLRNSDLDIDIACSFEPPIPYAKLKNTDPIGIHTLRFQYNRYLKGEHKGQRKLDRSCEDADGETLTVRTTYGGKGVAPKFEPLTTIPQEVREAAPLIYIGTDRSLRRQLPAERGSLLRRIFEDIDADFNDPSQVVKVAQKDGTELERTRKQRFAQFLGAAMELLRTDKFLELEGTLKRNALEQLGLDPKTDDLDLYFSPPASMDFYKSLDLIVREHGFEISATEMGGGIQNAIVIAILRAFEETRKKGAIVLIEEPEMFLHPQMQRSLYSTLRRISETNQVIYTTHSPHFVSVPEYRDVLIIRKTDDGTTTGATRSTLANDNRRREKFIKEFDPERNELFFARRLLVVEGDTEKLAFPEYARRLKLDLDSSGATIVEVGGKRNLKDFAEVAASFKIPVGVVYDKDSSDFRDKHDEEDAFNARLDGLATEDGSVRVWRLTDKFEDVVRGHIGEKNYQALCQRYRDCGKPTRQRLIATDDDMTVPPSFEEILKWLAGAS